MGRLWCESTAEFPSGGASRGSCEGRSGLPAVPRGTAPSRPRWSSCVLCPFLPGSSPACPPSLATPFPAGKPCGGPTGPFRRLLELCPIGQAPSTGAPIRLLSPWDLAAPLSGPLSPPAHQALPSPGGPSSPSHCRPKLLGPRSWLPWGHRPTWNAGARGPQEDILLPSDAGTPGTHPSTQDPLGRRKTSPDTSRGEVMRTVCVCGEGRAGPRVQPGRAVSEAPGAWGQVVEAGLSWRGVWLGCSFWELRARPGSCAGLPEALLTGGQDAGLSRLSVLGWSGCVLGPGGRGLLAEPQAPPPRRVGGGIPS